MAKRPIDLEVADGREDDLDLAGPVAGQRVVRRDPHVGDGLPGVVRGDLAGRRRRHEEAGVVAARRAPRRDPVGEVVDVADREAQALVAAQVEEAARAVVDGDPLGGEARLLLGVPGQEVGAALAPGQEDARLLEGLADDGDPVGEATRLEAQQRAGSGIGPAGAERLGLGAPVERVDGPAGEHVGPAHEVRAQVAPHHQHLEGGPARGRRRVAHEHDRGGRADLHRGRARTRPRGRWWRGSRWRHAGEGTGSRRRRPRNRGTP